MNIVSKVINRLELEKCKIEQYRVGKKFDATLEEAYEKLEMFSHNPKASCYELIPTSEKMKPYKVAIFFSGLERSLKNSKYNLRQDECKAAAYALMGYAGMDYDTFANTRLRDVPFEVFEAYKDRLPELWRRRAENIITVNLPVPKRVQSCGVKVIWRATVSSFLRVANLPFTAMSAAAMN